MPHVLQVILILSTQPQPQCEGVVIPLVRLDAEEEVGGAAGGLVEHEPRPLHASQLDRRAVAELNRAVVRRGRRVGPSHAVSAERVPARPRLDGENLVMAVAPRARLPAKRASEKGRGKSTWGAV